MARAVAARMHGDDYQARVFWLNVCRLFEDRSKVDAVEIEAECVKSLDDVAVHYVTGMLDADGSALSADYFQVKFHVASDGALTWEALIDPAFINAASVSLLKRIHDAQRQYAPSGTGARFVVYSPWTTHPDNELARLVSQTDGHIRCDLLMEGGPKSAMGKVRLAWCKHLGLTTEDDLLRTLAPIRIETGPTMSVLGSRLNDKLQLAGLRPVEAGVLLHPYDALAKKLVQNGRTKVTRLMVEKLCRTEGLWVGTTPLAPGADRIGIRSFLRFAEHLEDETDEMLCLLRHFEGRSIVDPDGWGASVVPEVVSFLSRVVQPGRSYLIFLPAHGTIAFVTGWCLDPKSGANVTLVQTGLRGRELWQQPPAGTPQPTDIDWRVSSTRLADGGTDVAVAISATHDIEYDVALYAKEHLPAVGRVVHYALPTVGHTSIQDAPHAAFLAQRLAHAMKTLRAPEERGGTIHVFFAMPNALAFFLGQLSRGLGRLVLYEFAYEAGDPGAYRPSASLPPQRLNPITTAQKD